MSRGNILETLKNARKKGYALPAFNIFNYVSARGVIEAANELHKPIIIQTSTGTVKEFGVNELFGLLKPLIDASEEPVFLNLDHCTSPELARQCVDAGWDMVMFDGSKLPFEENIKLSREITEYANKKGAFVEGELGTIAGVEEDIAAESGSEASFEECMEYLEKSGINIFAPAVGTAHGVYKGVPKLNFELVRKLSDAVETPLVIHGGTGLSEGNFKRFVQSGAGKINISTALKHAYLDGMKNYLDEQINQYNPLDADRTVKKQIKEAAQIHINMFQV